MQGTTFPDRLPVLRHPIIPAPTPPPYWPVPPAKSRIGRAWVSDSFTPPRPLGSRSDTTPRARNLSYSVPFPARVLPPDNRSRTRPSACEKFESRDPRQRGQPPAAPPPLPEPQRVSSLPTSLLPIHSRQRSARGRPPQNPRRAAHRSAPASFPVRPEGDPRGETDPNFRTGGPNAPRQPPRWPISPQKHFADLPKAHRC